MSRVIKFRAWDKFNAEMWHSKDSLGVFFTNMEELEKAGNGITFMQFTGLHDCDGTEIYEGDILKWVSSNPFSLGEVRRVQVTYVEAHFWCQGRSIGVYLGELLVNEKCKVIGNVYTDPEMIQL